MARLLNLYLRGSFTSNVFRFLRDVYKSLAANVKRSIEISVKTMTTTKHASMPGYLAGMLACLVSELKRLAQNASLFFCRLKFEIYYQLHICIVARFRKDGRDFFSSQDAPPPELKQGVSAFASASSSDEEVRDDSRRQRQQLVFQRRARPALECRRAEHIEIARRL